MSKFSVFNVYTKQGVMPPFLLGIPQKKAMMGKAFTQPVLTTAKPAWQEILPSYKYRLKVRHREFQRLHKVA